LALFEDSSGGKGELQCLEHPFMPDVDCLSTSAVAKQGASCLLLVHDADFSGAGGAFKLTATVGSSAQVAVANHHEEIHQARKCENLQDI